MVLMSTHNPYFEQKFEIYQIFLSENFHFLVVKFSVYLNRHDFIIFDVQIAFWCLFFYLFVCICLLLFYFLFYFSQFIKCYTNKEFIRLNKMTFSSFLFFLADTRHILLRLTFL